MIKERLTQQESEMSAKSYLSTRDGETKKTRNKVTHLHAHHVNENLNYNQTYHIGITLGRTFL